MAYTYIWLFTRVPVNTPAVDKERTFNSGTMSTAVTTIFNEGKAISSSPIASFTLGTIENPKYPWDGTTDWVFTDTYVMSFYFNNIFQAISSFSDITNSDFMVSPDKVFSFKKRIGQERTDISLLYGRGGNVDDYDSPLDGYNFCNDLVVMSRNETGANVIKTEPSDSSSYSKYSRLWSTMSLDETIAQKMLDSKGKNYFSANNAVDNEISLVLNEKAMPIGSYNLGDTLKVIIKDGPINFNNTRRVIGWKCFIRDNMVERTTIITNNNVYN